MTSTESFLVALSRHAVDADVRHLMILARIPKSSDRPHAAENAELDQAAKDGSAAREAMSGLRADTLAGCQAKARALMTGVVHSDDLDPIIHDNEGLVWSLLLDLSNLGGDQMAQDIGRAPYAESLAELVRERGGAWHQAVLATIGEKSFQDIPAERLRHVLACV